MPRPDRTPPIRAHRLSPVTLRRPTPVALTGWAESSGWALRYVDPSVITPADDSQVDRGDIATFAAVIPATGATHLRSGHSNLRSDIHAIHPCDPRLIGRPPQIDPSGHAVTAQPGGTFMQRPFLAQSCADAGRRCDQAWLGCDDTFVIRVRRDGRLDAATHRRDLSDIVCHE